MSTAREQRLKRLTRGKAASLGVLETWSMTHAGKIDGKEGLLRCNDSSGVWESSFLKHEVDACEELAATEYGHLKIEMEDEFQKLNVLFDQVVPIRMELADAQARLSAAQAAQVDLTQRKPGEAQLTEMQVKTRRQRERDEQLAPLLSEVGKLRETLTSTIEAIFSIISAIHERFDSSRKIVERYLQHSQRRIDVYWRSALRYVEALPALPDVKYTSTSEAAFAAHFKLAEARAEKLRRELELEEVQ